MVNVAVVNFQVSVLKVLSSYPNGLAKHADMKRDLAFLATSGADWADYSKRLGAAFPSLDIFTLGMVQRSSFGWRLTSKGAIALQMMEGAVRGGVPAFEAAWPSMTVGTIVASAAETPTPMVSPSEPKAPADRRGRFTVIEGGRSEAA